MLLERDDFRLSSAHLPDICGGMSQKLIASNARRLRRGHVARRMTRFRRPQPWTASLALAASLMLSLLPAVGRLHARFAADPAAEISPAICTVGGLAYRPVVSSDPQRAGESPAREDGREPAAPDDDCVYCLLATAMHPPSAPQGAALLPPLPQTVPEGTRIIEVSSRRLTGLGPRGPPDASRAG